ncbi:reverse transcriptase, partial [Trifolium medium]|nr:reverse transcriptase [Trifolium medium]
LMPLPANKKPIAVKWVYKVKHFPDGTIAKHKARLVAKGCLQKPDIDIKEMVCQSDVATDVGTSCAKPVNNVPEFKLEVCAPVARLETVRLVVAVANQLNCQIVQPNVKSAFLNGKLEEEVYVEQPQGFKVKGAEDKVSEDKGLKHPTNTGIGISSCLRYACNSRPDICHSVGM